MAETEPGTVPQTEPETEPEPDTGTAGTGGADGATVRTDAPYRAQAVRGDSRRDGDRWHLTVQSLDDHPDRGEVDALVVTVTARTDGDRFPAADLDRTLRQCGFDRDDDWAAQGSASWTAPCVQSRTGAAPPAPPVPPAEPAAG